MSITGYTQKSSRIKIFIKTKSNLACLHFMLHPVDFRSQFIGWFAGEKTSLFCEWALDNIRCVDSAEVTSRFRFYVPVVHFHVDYFHKFNLSGQFLNFFLKMDETKCYSNKNEVDYSRAFEKSYKLYRSKIVRSRAVMYTFHQNRKCIPYTIEFVHIAMSQYIIIMEALTDNCTLFL